MFYNIELVSHPKCYSDRLRGVLPLSLSLPSPNHQTTDDPPPSASFSSFSSFFLLFFHFFF